MLTDKRQKNERRVVIMYLQNTFEPAKIDNLIQLAIQEDIFTGDITTENLIPENLIVEGAFIAKENGIIAGLPVIEYFFLKRDKNVFFKQWVKDGIFVPRPAACARPRPSEHPHHAQQHRPLDRPER